MPFAFPRRTGLFLSIMSLLATAGLAQATYTPVTVDIGTPLSLEVDVDALRQGIDPGTVSMTPAPEHVGIEYVSDASFRVTATSVGVDSVALGYCDATGACDTAFLEITSRLPREITRQTVYDTVGVPGFIQTFCLDTTQLPGVITTVTDICEDPPRTFVEFVYAENTFCTKYRGLELGGTDSTCLVVCDDLGFCDTTVIIVTTRETEPFEDVDLEFFVDKGQSDFTVLDISEFTVRPDLENTCADESGDFVGFAIDEANSEVSFDGLEVGTERACVLAKADNGTQKRYNITVHVVTRAPGADTIRVPVGQTRTWCFGEYELVGEPEGLFDACPATEPLVTTSTTADITCLDLLAGDAVGTQELCVNLCDATGRCDLVTLTVEVYAPDLDAPPVAVDDFVEVPESGEVTYAILANDRSDSPITSVNFVGGPFDGTARLDENNRLVYARSATAPCRDDEIEYEVCNANGCDRATVTLRPSCEAPTGRGPIKVMGALSPNDDGLNDTWLIENILQYPDNEIQVFNRWGTLVYRMSNYENQWAGTFQDGKPLPDGTYFYHVVIEGGSPITNYLQLRR